MANKFRFTQSGLKQRVLDVSAEMSRTGAKQIEFTDEETGSLRLVVYRTRKGVFWVRVNFNNQRVNVRLGNFPALSVANARAMARQIQVWIYEGKDPKVELKRGAMYFRLMAEEYLQFSLKTKRSYSSDESKVRLYLLDEFGRFHGDHITEQMVRDYHYKIADSLSKSTADKHLFLLRSIYRHHNEKGNLTCNPAEGVKPFREKKGEARYLTEAELTAFISACRLYPNAEIGALFMLLLSTGMRVGEALSLTFDDYDSVNRCIRLPLTKNGKPFVVHLNDFADVVMQQQHQKHGSGFVFPGKNGGHISRPHRAFKACLEHAKIDGTDLKIHSLRHTYASHLLMSGASLIEVSRLLNHSSISVTEIYSHLSDDSLRGASQRVSDLFSQGVTSNSSYSPVDSGDSDDD